jgi:hypothetical protein
MMGSSFFSKWKRWWPRRAKVRIGTATALELQRGHEYLLILPKSAITPQNLDLFRGRLCKQFDIELSILVVNCPPSDVRFVPVRPRV